jgi:hypothetical protein
MFSFHFLSFLKVFGDEIQSIEGLMLGGKLITLFWMNKALKIGIDHWTLKV